MKRSRSDAEIPADETEPPEKRAAGSASSTSGRNYGCSSVPNTAQASQLSITKVAGESLKAMWHHFVIENLLRMWRGAAFVYLHYVYGPCCYKRRVHHVHEFLTKKNHSRMNFEDAFDTAEKSPYHALLPKNSHSFVEADSLNKSLSLSDCMESFPRKRSAIRDALEARRDDLLKGRHTKYHNSASKHWMSRVPLEVRRDAVFDSVFESLLAAETTELLAGVHVRFISEDGKVEAGVDSGGLTREFFDLVLRGIIESSGSHTENDGLQKKNSVAGLGEPMFKEQADNALMLVSSSRPHAVYFALGRLVATLLVHASHGDVALPFPINDCLLKYIVGQPITATDVRKRDPLYYKNRIESVLKPGGIEEMCMILCMDNLTFTEDDVELMPGGAEKAVTSKNVEEYIALLSEEYVCGKVRVELSQFLGGFHGVVPQELLHDCGIGFSSLGTLLSGVPELDVDLWKKHSALHPAGVATDKAQSIADMLWATLAEWPQEERSAVLAFATGCSRLPAVGFEKLEPPFTVEIVPTPAGQTPPLPTAHTCFNRLVLPVYDSKGALAEKLHLATREGCGAFDLV